MKKVLFILYLLSIGNMASYGQIHLTQDPQLERQLQESGLIHQPLPLNIEHSFEAYGWKKEVLQSTPLTHTTRTEGWSHAGAGSISFSTEKTVSGKGSIRLQFPTFTGKRATGSPSDPDYATYGNSSVTYHLNGANLERYNRITFSIYPDCDGARIVNMNLTFQNADTPAKKGYNPPSGSHLINLVNKEWNHCFLEIDEEHYMKRFPVWFNIFNGNTAIHLSNGKSAAICGNFLKDKELLDIGLEQLYWTVGKNPFGQSLIYGEGDNYPQMNSFSSGEMTGEMPVGIRTLGNDDVPYWPQTNNACYKEVWVTSAGKWLSLIAEY